MIQGGTKAGLGGLNMLREEGGGGRSVTDYVVDKKHQTAAAKHV